MNLNLDLSGVTRFLRGTWNDLRQKHILPVAAVLLAAIVAVPLLLTSSSSSPSQPESPAPVPPPPSASTLPALNVESTPAHSVLVARARDPFATASGGSAGTTSTSTSAPNLGSVSSVATAANSAVNALNGATATSAGSSAGSSSTSSSSTSSSTSSSGGSGTSSSSTGSPSSSTGTAKPKPASSGLTSTQSYDVALSITNSSGGLNAIDKLQRLSVLPSSQQPLLVELGVLQGGKRVLFAVQPGAAVKGPGTCVPGPVDCEVVSLGRGQTEVVGRQSTSGVTKVALFAVTSIRVVDHSSASAAQKARKAASAAGRNVLRGSTLNALSLFRYENSLGALADLRTLAIG